MRTEICYITNDGKVFLNRDSALDWENESDLVQRFLDENIPEHKMSLNENEYVQLATGTHRTLKQFLVDEGIMYDDSSPLSKILYVIQRIDEYDRLWQQPYYAIQANEHGIVYMEQNIFGQKACRI